MKENKCTFPLSKIALPKKFAKKIDHILSVLINESINQ